MLRAREIGATPLSFLDAFHAVVERQPKSIAIEDGLRTITYAELWRTSAEVARALAAADLPNGALVAINLPKGADFISGCLGAWMARCSFAPFDVTWPEVRAQAAIEVAQPAAILGTEGGAPKLAVLNRFLNNGSSRPRELAYVVFTSGSTGIPKAIAVPHAGILPVLTGQITEFGLGSESRSLWLLSPSFDASISDWGTALLSGATLVIPPVRLGELTPQGVRSLLRERAITYVDIPPSILSLLDPRDLPPSVETIVIGGENCPRATVRGFASCTALFNVYGPSETTICASVRRCSPEWEDGDIGTPLPGFRFEVVDERGERVIGTAEGELWIAGVGVALGYLGAFEATSSRFVNAWGARWYRTGDAVRRRADGGFEFVGRIDRQVKLRGVRIELGDIEAALHSLPEVRHAAVVKSRTHNGCEFLHASVVPSTHEVDTETLRASLQTLLPATYVPASISLVPALPLNGHGKVDLSKIASEAGSCVEMPKTRESFHDALIELARLTLGDVNLTLTDNFFEQGGTSIEAFALLSALDTRGFHVNAAEMFRARTLGDVHPGDIANELGSYEADATLRASFSDALSRTAVDKASQAHLLVTGASGKLGSRVVARLLSETGALVTCITRSSRDTVTGRVKDALRERQIELEPDAWEKRLSVIEGDLTARHLGTRDHWDTLVETVTGVIHCAGSYDARATYSELMPLNVGAVHELLELCASHTRKSFVFASTLSVFSTVSGRTACGEEVAPPPPSDLFEPYARSKATAERLLHNAATAGLSGISIVRLPLLTGDDSRDTLIDGIIEAIGTLGAYPAGSLDSLTSASASFEAAAASIVSTALHPVRREPRIVHVPCATRTLGAILEARGLRGLAPLEPADWKRRVKQHSSRAAAALLAKDRRLGIGDASIWAPGTVDAFEASGLEIAPANLESCEAALTERGFGRADLYETFYLKEHETSDIVRLHERVRDLYGLGTAPHVFEVGCGTARLLPALAAAGFRVSGSEPDPDYAILARKKLSATGVNGEIRSQGFADLDIPPDAHLVTSINGPFSYVCEPRARKAALRRLYEGLRDGGVLLLDLPHFPWILRHYDPRRDGTSRVELQGTEIQLSTAHEIDFHRGVFVHRDEYRFVTPGKGTLRALSVHRLAVISLPELMFMLEETGFGEVRTFSSYAAEEPSEINGPRIILSARKPRST